MLDMHAHILPNVDDGPKTVMESIDIIRHMASEGVTEIITTSHAFSPHYHVDYERVKMELSLLQQELQKQQVDVTLYAGQEVRIHEQLIENLQNGVALSLANSKYVLLELPSGEIPAYTIPMIQEMIAINKIPIIAHPERNRAIAEKPSRLERLIKNGALAQITAGSVAGHFGKNIQKLSLQLIEANLIHTYGSDVHNNETRPALFEKGLDYLDKKNHHELVDIFLENNARILTNEEFIVLEPQAIEKRKWWQVIG